MVLRKLSHESENGRKINLRLVRRYSGAIEFEVDDDGKGFDIDAIREKAIKSV